MSFYTVVASIIALQFACARAGEYSLASSGWAEPSRTKWCPVHAPFDITNGNKVVLIPPTRGSFSLAEASATLPPNHATIGLRLTVSATGATMPSFWRVALRLNTGGEKVRFISPFEVPSNGIAQTILLPWTSFEGQKMRAGGTDPCGSEEMCILNLEELTHISIIWRRKDGLEEPTLVLHEVVATSLTEVARQRAIDVQCSCNANCLHCMASSWAQMVFTYCSSSTTWNMCLAVRRSLAERIILSLSGNCALPGAADAVNWLTSTMDVIQCANAVPSLLATVLGDVLQGVFSVALPVPESGITCSQGDGSSAISDYAGPFVGWGISGHNDLSNYRSETVDSCLDKCRVEPRCKSIDYGARGSAQGQCWLSTADRFKAASSFSNKWAMYDYYEAVSVSKVGQATNAGTMLKSVSTDVRAELLSSRPEGDCCAAPANCISAAIAAGSPIYNSGNHLGCFLIYHDVAERLGGCTVGRNVFPDARGLMQATAKASETDTHPGHAAWRLRHAFDAYSNMLRPSNLESTQCKQRVSLAMVSNVSGAYDASSRPQQWQVVEMEKSKSPVGGNETTSAASGCAHCFPCFWIIAAYLPVSMYALHD